MEWWLVLLIYFAGLVFLLLLGTPVAFAFLAMNFTGMYMFTGGTTGWGPLVLSIYDSLANFVLIAILGFVFMADVLIHSGVYKYTVDAIDMWVGRVPGRLSILSVIAGTLFGALSGSAIASCALLGTLFMPEMRRRGYSKSMSLGPIMGSGQLDTLIPPSNLMVVLGSLSDISVAALLIGGVLPGLLLAALFMGYIVLRCWINPSIAPPYEEERVITLAEKSTAFVRHVLPLSSIIFLALGTMFLGIATPSEASALGAMGALILALANRKLDFNVLKKSILGTAHISFMIFMIIAGSVSFSRLLGLTGAITGLVEYVVNLGLSPLAFAVAALVVVLILGCFIDQMSILMITTPIFIPVAHTLGINTVWFGVMLVLGIEVGVKTPPFGIFLFMMKGMSPTDSMAEIIRAAFPFVIMDMIALTLMLFFPAIVTFLPQLMH